MRKWIFFLAISLWPFFNSYAVYPTNLRLLEAQPDSIQRDLDLIRDRANIPGLDFSFVKESHWKNMVTLSCAGNNVRLSVKAKDGEWSSTLYYGLQKLGFLFPHPRLQITPSAEEMRQNCGKTFEWRPAYAYRGSHLHTLHPNEWVDGFFMGNTAIAYDLIRWLARNGQNIFDLNLLQMKNKDIFYNLRRPFNFAKAFGIHAGVTLGAAQNQQNSYKLLSLFTAITGWKSVSRIKTNLRRLLKGLDISYLVMNAGTSEFTATNYQRTLNWLEAAADVTNEIGAAFFAAVHVSTNQHQEPWGNFNFLPQYASEKVGALPHTVMFYGLYDTNVPMYGNDSFKHMLGFVEREKNKRPVWYYPETSYWLGLDVDAPLLLTDYLSTRAEDMKNLYHSGVEGHVNFTSGHELGYWLFDWSLTLFNNLDYQFDPMIALKLLGEDQSVWKEFMDFQTRHLKENQLIQILTFPTVQDELAKGHRIHDRNTVKDLSRSPAALDQEIGQLSKALDELPDVNGIKNSELKAMARVTRLRVAHAWLARMALKNQDSSSKKEEYLKLAKNMRLKAQAQVDYVMSAHNRYPESFVFKRRRNPTAYSYGYGYPASSLHFWRQEERRIYYRNYNPFFMNIYNILDIVF